MEDDFNSFDPPPEVRRDWEKLWPDIGIEIALRKGEESKEKLLAERLALYASVNPKLLLLVSLIFRYEPLDVSVEKLEDILQTEKRRLPVFDFETDYWVNSPVVTNGIVLPSSYSQPWDLV